MRTVLITGVSRGIGKATAARFLEGGWRVIGTSTTGKASLKDKNLTVYKLKLEDKKSVDSLVERVRKNKYKIDVLINNAGIEIDKGNQIPRNILTGTLEVNLVGTVDLTEKLLPFISNGGHIVNVSSVLGSFGNFMGGYSPSYKISKAALNMYSIILAGRLKRQKITVYSFHPGWVKTDLGGPDAIRKPEEPANELFELINSKKPTGLFWYKNRKFPW